MNRVSPLSYIRKQKKLLASVSLWVAGMQVFGYSGFLGNGNQNTEYAIPDFHYYPEPITDFDRLFPYNLKKTYFDQNKAETPVASEKYPKEVLPDINSEKHFPSIDRNNNLPSVENITESIIHAESIAENKQGIIGKSETFPIDDPSDNTFAVTLDDLPENSNEMYLVYDLFGLEDAAGTSVTINDHYSRGGYLVKKSEKWITHKERINPEELVKGINYIRFSTLASADHQYMIKNLRLESEEQGENTRNISLHQTELNSYDGYVYLSGYTDKSIKILLVNGKEVPVTKGVFETIIENAEEEITITTENEELIIPVSEKIEESPDRISELQVKNVFAEKQFLSETENIWSEFGAALTVSAGSMEKDTQFFLSALRYQDISAVSPEMVNVTGTHSGFRLLPHGEHFVKEPATLEIPYDESKIPPGYKPQDIKTFYFDQQQSKWAALERDTVLLDKKVIVSKTTHFTDFINGIIKVPESPETGSFTPTSIKDIKAADPAAGVVSIAPPTPNNMGTANTSFPIKLPAGRAGMQPFLSVNYNSEGGNGWMGIGWDISLPSISIDTRWGAPRYDGEIETEIYSLGGGMLVLNDNNTSTDNNPNINDLTNPHRTADIKRRVNRQFYPRIEGSYAKIERKGGSPSTYWWEVTDKMGNKSFYGGYDGAVVDNAVIKTAEGNIAHWALYRTEDTDGNYVQYHYTKGQGSNGHEFYPQSIEYTKHKTNATPQHYRVSFVLDSEITSPSARTDIHTNARLGLVQSTSKLLNEIKIDLMEGVVAEPIRSYRFEYQNPNFSKKQLKYIAEYDANGQLFYSNRMEYFNEVTDGDFMDTNESNDWNGYSDNIEGGLIPLSGNQFNNRGSFLGTTKSWGINGGASFNVGVGFNYFSKQNTVGVNLGYGYNESDGLISFVDMNGDGLPDKLFKRGSSVYYRPNKGEFVQSGQPRFGDPIIINGLSNFSKNVSNSFSLGAEANFILFLGYTYTTSKSKQKIYLSDVNGDGLVDVARPNGVIFNSTIQENTDIRNFLISTESTPNYIPGGQVNSDIILDMGLETREELEAQNPLHDVLKRWVAPVSGTIQITGTAILTPVILPDSGDEYYADYDGVRVSIERHRGNPGELAYNREQYSPQNLTITNPNGNFNNSITVEKGDRLYFRVHSRYEGSYDRVNWTPDIKYTMIGGGMDISLETNDANGFPYFSSSADEGFILSAEGGVTLPTDATAVVEWDEMESQYSFPAYNYSDNLIFRVIIGNVNLETGDFIPLTTFTKTANQSSSNTITKSGFFSGSTSLANYTIPSGRTVKFEVYSNSNVDWKKINWKPRVKMSIDGQSRTFNAIVNYGIYNKKVNTSNLTARKAVTANKPIQLTIERTNQAFLNDNLEVNDCKKITLVAKNNQKRVLLTKTFHAKVIQSLGNYKNLALYNNASSCSGSIVTSMTNYITNTANITNPVFTEFYTDDWDLAQVGLFKATLMQQDINNQYTVLRGLSNEILAKDGNDQFGSGYRYWGQLGYNSTAANPTNPGVLIDEGKFDFDTGEIDPNDVPTEDPDCNCGNPEDEGYSDCMEVCMDDYISGLDLSGMQNSVFVQFSPLPKKELIENEWYADVWNGYDSETYVEEDAFSSSRLGIKNINTIYVDPTTINGQFIPGITIVSHGDGDSVVGGVGPIGGSWSGSFNYTKNQFMDMNGDRYPDIVTENRIQFTSPRGNLDDTRNFPFGRPTTGENNLLGSSVSGTFLFATNGNSSSPSVSLDMGGLSDIPITPKTAPQPNSSASFSGSSSQGSNDEYLLWVDMNGDGLPDRVYAEESPIRVSLNLGYGFAEPQVWGNAPTSISGRTENFSSSAGGSFSIMNDSWGGGISVSASEAFTNENFVDLNGDGLPDRVRQDGGTIRYRLNTGTGFGPENIIGNAMVQFNRSTSQGANASFTFGFGFFGLKATTSIKAAINDAVDRIENTISDINGDGYADILYTDSGTNDGSLSVRLNKTGKTHLLKRINLPLGGHWEIDYEREANSYEMPNAKWKMTSIEIHDGFNADNEFTPDVAKTSVEYENPRHDRREREFMGYETVRVNQLDVLNSDEIYRYSLQQFHNNSYYLKGAVKKESLYDDNNFEWTSTETTYTVTNRVNLSIGFLTQAPDFEFGNARDKASLFVSPIKTTKKFFEPSGSKTTFTEIKGFDNYGNITQYIDNGEGGSDEVTTHITYDDPNYRGLPTYIEVEANGSTVRQRDAKYDVKANLEWVKTKLNDEDTAQVSFTYDPYGNIQKVTHEESQDENGNPFYYEYTYDPKVHTYPVTITDAFGYSSNNTYDYRFGALVYTEDMNYMPMRTRIDNRGRVVEITGPYELFVEGFTSNDNAWTIRFEYEGQGPLWKILEDQNIGFNDYVIDGSGSFIASTDFTNRQTTKKHHALTRHFDPEFRTDPETPITENEIYTITLIDGLGKPIQVKKSTSIKTAVTNATGEPDAAVIDARDTRYWLINGKVVTDAFGRARKTWYPTTETLTLSSGNPSETAYDYVATPHDPNSPHTQATYDVLDRVRTTTLPGETAQMTMAYAIENSLFKTTVTNEKSQTKHSFTDVRGRTAKVVEEATVGNIETTFEYNAIGELLKVTDTGGNETISEYDLAGRRTKLEHPDNGVTLFKYDKASNLTFKQTANLEDGGNDEKIEYFYTFNRLDSIVYPKNPHNNVHFFYGQAQDASAADDFSVGRLWYQIDATGVQQFKYGRLGEVRYNLRSVAVPGDKAYWFKTEWEYDTWNRVKKIIYPDEEEVTYFYNRGGELHGITSKKQEQQNEDIISQLGYDKFGQRTYLRYGNGTETEYSYETNRRRLENMTAKSNTTYGSSVNRTFMNNNYSYDVLSNVLSVENTAALPTTGQIGGSVLYEYGYDDLNRLETANAIFTGRNATDNGYEQQQYSLIMEYDNMHNIVSKEQLHQKAPGETGGTFTDIPATTYRLDYAYEPTNKPHAPREIIDKPYATSTGNDIKTKTYDYDANGNMISLTQKTGESDVVEKLRTNLWDEENRLRAVDLTPDAEGIRPIAIYTYDAGGERILKHSNTSVSIYLNGKKVADTIQTDATLYPSGMLVARVIPTEEESLSLGYTKHYYAGTQRVSSKIGTTENLGDFLQDWFTQGTGGPVDVIGSSFGVLENAEEGVVQVYDELGIEPPTYESTPVFIPVQSFVHGDDESEIYWFHPDHLGSTSYISNILGEVSQHMEYFAFGETFVEEHRSSNNSPYKFNGKELDEETGWYYYGARYYDPRVSVWLSVDPLVEKTLQPYQYGYQNPIKYVDPDGRNPIVIIGGVAVTVYELAAITLFAAGTTYTGYMLSKDVNGTISFHNPFGGGYGNPNDWTTSRGDQWFPKEFLKGTRGIPNINPGGGKKGLWTSIVLALGSAGSLYLRNKDYTNYYIDKVKGLSAEFLSNEIQTENYNGYDIKFNIMKYHLKYEVKEGDNLSSISESFGISMEQIIELNNIKDPDKIGTGTSLILAEDYVVDADVQQNPASKKDNIRISNQESIRRQVMEKEIKQKEQR